MLIQYKRADEALVLGPGGLPAGDIEDRGSVTFLGREIPKHVLVFEGKEKVVFYGDRFEDLEFYMLQAEVDQILESFERVPPP